MSKYVNFEMLLDNLNIEQVISDFGNVQIKNKYCCCPIHNENTPSLKIYPETNTFYCFGCHVGGNSIHFVSKLSGIDFYKSAVQLIERYNLDNCYEDKQKKKAIDYSDFTLMHEKAVEWSVTAYKYLVACYSAYSSDEMKKQIQQHIDTITTGSNIAKRELYLDDLEKDIISGLMVGAGLLPDDADGVKLPNNFQPLELSIYDTTFFNKWRKYSDYIVFTDEQAQEKPSHECDFLSHDDKGKVWISPPKLASRIRKDSKYIFVKNHANDSVIKYWYSDGVYKQINDNELKGKIKGYITYIDENLLKMRDVKEVFENLTTDLNFIKGENLNTDENIINFENGLLYLDTMELKPHNPEILSTIQIPCKWTGKPTETPVFDKFMNEFTEDRQDIKQLLLEYMGVAVSNVKGQRMKKALFIVGNGDTGKSKLKELTEKLIGSENCYSASISDLEKRFGVANVYNKRLVGDNDASFMSVRELKMLKLLTGGDSIPLEFKGKTQFNYTYNGVLWFCMNQLPRFSGDRGEWVYNRLMIVRADNVIPKDKQDKMLIDKLYSEREGIVYKIIQALRTVINNRYNYSIPQSCLDILEQYKIDNSPVKTFYYSCCTPRLQENGKQIKDNCTTKKIYDAFKLWCKDNNNGYSVTRREFTQELMEMFKYSDINELQYKNNNTYYHFTLSLDAKREFNVVDTVQ